MPDKFVMSFSQMKTVGCARRWELQYAEGLEKIPSADSRNLVFGTAFHEGMAAGLRASYLHKDILASAREAAIQNLKDVRIENKRAYDGSLDLEYYAMLDDVQAQCTDLLDWFLPQVGLGVKYRVASEFEVFGSNHADDPMIEWSFEYELNDVVSVRGIVDAVLVDIETGAYVIVDWKTRKSIIDEEMALLDGQVHLYDAVIHALGGKSDTVCMWQVRKVPPAPATLTKKNIPSLAANAKATTWGVWWMSLPPAVRNKYKTAEDAVDVKSIKPMTYFHAQALANPSDISRQFTMDEVVAKADQVAYYQSQLDKGRELAGAYSSDFGSPCQGCWFKKLCGTALRYGGDVSAIIEQEFQIREGYAPVEDTE